jgi:hypothetical protein
MFERLSVSGSVSIRVHNVRTFVIVCGSVSIRVHDLFLDLADLPVFI